MADTVDSKSIGREAVRVQVPPRPLDFGGKVPGQKLTRTPYYLAGIERYFQISRPRLGHKKFGLYRSTAVANGH
jgi:hypothetical protein